ncbi:RDD family protein [Planctellipticum variicoloris]|uniref:RDD family protein n=1 Tax=Planctellipticum variicoloris TaxID=3064265 RepID=UPI00301348C2|nr:RDD family protein [Planctomycetaceae bacterium SH412]
MASAAVSPSVSSGSLDLVIETPENVLLTWQLAGPAWRLAAYAVDFAIRASFLVAGCIAMTVVALVLPGTAIGSLLLLMFLLEWGYTIGFEYFWQGQTPGKRLCGLRVIQDNGQPLSWWSATLRNLLRAGDTIPFLLIYGEHAGLLILIPCYGPALIAMLLAPRLQRLGDLAARTVVVHEKRPELPRPPMILDKIDAIPRDELGSRLPRPATLALIDEFLARREVLSYERGHALAGPFAEALARSLGYRGDPQLVEQYPMAFLARVHVTFARQRDADGDDDSPARRRPRKAGAAAS